MYLSEVISILKSSPIGLKARRLAWNEVPNIEAFIIYDAYMGEFTYTRRQKFDEDTIMTSCLRFYPSLSDAAYDDWEIFE